MTRLPGSVGLGLMGLVLGLALLALTIGPFPLSARQALAALFGAGDPAAQAVVQGIRLPRVIAALVVGGALAAAGASYQVLFRNPLVSPDILGVSAGAGLGAAAGITLAVPAAAVPVFAFAGGLGAVVIVVLVAATVRHADKILSLVLTGVVIGALAGAGTALLKVLADPFGQLPAVTFWLLGSLASTTLEDILPVSLVISLGFVPLWLLRWRIHVLMLGDDDARALGVNVTHIRVAVIAAATLITASVTAIAGVVGWVGLVIPHIARMLVGANFARLLPISATLGAGYLLVVDTLARSLAAIEVPLGILTALIGAPFFIWLLLAGRRGWS